VGDDDRTAEFVEDLGSHVGEVVGGDGHLGLAGIRACRLAVDAECMTVLVDWLDHTGEVVGDQLSRVF